MLVLPAAVAVVLALPAQSPPAAAPAATPRSMASVRAADLEFERASVVRVYERAGRRDPKWDERALRFLDEACRLFANTPDQPTYAELANLGSPVVRAGCDDPMVLAAQGVALRGETSEPVATGVLERAVAGLILSEYPPHRLAITAHALAEQYEARGQPAAAALPTLIAVDAFARALTAPGLAPLEQEYLLGKVERRLDDTFPRAAAERLVQAVVRSPRADPWLAAMVQGKWHIRLAWSARGGGFSNTVTPAGQKGFEEHMAKARGFLERAHELAPDRPQAATSMIRVAMGHSTDPTGECRRWFDRAVAVQLDWMPAYSAYLWTLWPRWYGSYDDMIAFGLECAGTGRHDTDVPQMLFRAMLDASRDSGDFATLWMHEELLARVVEVLESAAAHPAHARRADSLRSSLAGVYWRAEKYDKAAELLRALGPRLDAAALVELRGTPATVRGDAFVYASPVADQVRRAESLVRAGELDAAIAGLREALAACPKEPKEAVAAVADRLSIAEVTAALRTDQWHTLEVREGSDAAPGWRALRGTAGGRAAVKGRHEPAVFAYPDNGLMVLHGADLGFRFEIEAEFDCSMLIGDAGSRAGFVFGYDPGTINPRWYSFMVEPKGGRTAVAFTDEFANPVPVPDGTTDRFRLNLRCWDGDIAASVNGTVVWPFPVQGVSNWQPGPGFGFATSAGTRGTLVVRDLRVRRLATP